MSIVAIISSPQKGANTDFVVNTIAKSAEENGKEVKVFSINPMADRKGCQGCDGCKRNGGTCVIKDDLTPILEAVRDAEGLIISSPVYFGEACAQYRLFEDRMYGFLKADFSPSFDVGKKVVAVTAAGSGGADELADKMLRPMTGFFRMEAVGKIAMITGNDRKYAENNAEVIAQARTLGKRL
jgi:multimeric flavodoxin WrbA